MHVDVEQTIGRGSGECREVGDPRAVARTIAGDDVLVQDIEVEKGAIYLDRSATEQSDDGTVGSSAAAVNVDSLHARRVSELETEIGAREILLELELSLAARVAHDWKPFEKARWLDVLPEYDPYKYNSFPKNAGRQSHLLTRDLQDRLERGAEAKLGEKLPPVLAFQSIVDATVDVTAVEGLFRRLRGVRHELVLFDINHTALNEGLLKPRFLARTGVPIGDLPHYATHTLVTNTAGTESAVEARRWAPGATEPVVEALEAGWPPYVFSLAHVAIPFSPDDPLYGASPMKELPLGRLNLKGERGVLLIPAAQLARLRHNPFFGYIERRIRERILAQPHESW